jgi:hypothetical protein
MLNALRVFEMRKPGDALRGVLLLPFLSLERLLLQSYSVRKPAICTWYTYHLRELA